MKLHPGIRGRRSIRLKGYDYSQPGAYFVTIVTQDRECLFGDVAAGTMRLSAAGRMVRSVWEALPRRFPAVDLDAFVVMPNHIHGIIVIVGTDSDGRATTRVAPTDATADAVGAPLVGAPDDDATAGTVGAPDTVGAPLVGALDSEERATTRVAPTLGSVVGAFKSLTTVEYTRGVHGMDWPPFRGRLWQRNYHERIVRDDASLDRIRRYILNNPAQWDADPENPAVVSPRNAAP